jgi:hypothetical protein
MGICIGKVFNLLPLFAFAPSRYRGGCKTGTYYSRHWPLRRPCVLTSRRTLRYSMHAKPLRCWARPFGSRFYGFITRPGRAAYPRSFGAVVFEMGGILWFYTATDGTQSLSIRLGRAKEDEQDLGPLLSSLDPGFTHWESDSGGYSPVEKSSVPPNACFIQSVALLRNSLSLGIHVEHARLLSYYVSYPTGLKGHTVLYLETDKGPTVIDPLMQRWPLHVQSADTADPKCVAYCIRHDVASARWVPISPNDFPFGRDESAHFSNN